MVDVDVLSLTVSKTFDKSKSIHKANYKSQYLALLNNDDLPMVFKWQTEQRKIQGGDKDDKFKSVSSELVGQTP